MKIRVQYFAFIFLILPLQIKAGGSWELVKKINFGYTLSTTAIDRYGNFYCSSTQGDIYQYDKSGILLNNLSSRQLGKIYLMEASHGLRVFAFYQDLQEYLITDRFLANKRNYSLQGSNSFIRLANLSMDLNLWVIDDNDLSIQKLDINNQEILMQHQWAQNILSDAANFVAIKEYKNRLYLLDERKKIYVFDNLINLLYDLEAPFATNFAFARNMIYLYNDSMLEAIDLGSMNREKSPLPEKIIEMQVYEGRFYLFTAEDLSIYRYNPL